MTYVYITADEVIDVTEKAIHVQRGDDFYWLPKSQIEEPDKFEVGDRNITVGMTEWIAQQKEIEGDE